MSAAEDADNALTRTGCALIGGVVGSQPCFGRFKTRAYARALNRRNGLPSPRFARIGRRVGERCSPLSWLRLRLRAGRFALLVSSSGNPRRVPRPSPNLGGRLRQSLARPRSRWRRAPLSPARNRLSYFQGRKEEGPLSRAPAVYPRPAGPHRLIKEGGGIASQRRGYRRLRFSPMNSGGRTLRLA